MQDRYAGDVGDFGKYGLLNEICKNSNKKFRLGFNWYYVTREEKKPGNGKCMWDYLRDDNPNSKNYRNCFPNLYDQLKEMVDCGQGNIREIEKGAVLPRETIFYSKPVPATENLAMRKVDRENWFKESLAKLKMADIIFLDPDNGIQTETVKKTHTKAIKYVFADEIQRYSELGKSLIIYNHRDRTLPSSYKLKLLSITTTPLKAYDAITVLKFKRFSVRHYVFLMQREHKDLIERTIDNLTREPYNFLFEEYPIN